MKKLNILFFCAFLTIGYSQNQTNGLDKNNASLIDVMVSTGISSASSTFSDNSYAADGGFFELSSTYYFSKLGLGVALGSFSNPTEGNLLDFTNKADYPIELNSEKWKTSYYGIGPSYKTAIGDLEAIIFGRAGIMSVKPISLTGNYVSENADAAITIPVYDFSTNETSKIGFYNAGIKLGYKLNPNLGLYILANYLSAFSDDIIAVDGRKQFVDIDKDGVITEIDIIRQDGEQVKFQYSEKNIQPQVFNYGFGLSYSIGKSTTKLKEAEKPNAKKRKSQLTVGDELPSGILKTDTKKSKIATKVDKAINAGTVIFTNPSKKDTKKQQKLITVSPKNNSQFKSVDEIENFTWELIGEKIPNPQYIIEITKIGSNRQPQRTYIGTTSDTKIAAKKVAKFYPGKALADELVNRVDNSGNINEDKAGDGHYQWKVTETTTGISSNPSFFSISNCDINFSITNDEIECLGYEGANRKFKICFDATYSSTSGDLTFANPLSGLIVFDQSYTSLTYTLVGPNPVLLTQIGATTTTVSYCFEVVAPNANNVTSIGFGLQGDDLDPSPITCQPGVGAIFTELPDCFCDECEDIKLSIDKFNISSNGASGNQFNFNGNVNVNVPIYGIEFQVQSYSYSANPSACTQGVSSVEESGMLLIPGTTINGSTSLQLVNETASGSPNSNNNATKNIKYTSNSPLTGPIPVNLTIGLPGPITGLDPSCCVIDYKVCIKVKIYYEDGSCKSCVFTQCFTFNNQ